MSDNLKRPEVTKVNVVAGVVIKQNEKFLLVQEKQEKCYGLWNLPAGKVDLGDSLERTAIKEAKEETGYDVELISKIGIFQKLATNAVKHVYEAKITGGEISVKPDEILDVKWFSLAQITKMELDGKIRDPFVLESIKILESK